MALYFSFFNSIYYHDSHSIDKKVYRIAELNEEIKLLRSEFVDTRTVLMTLKMESSIKNKLFEKGIKTSQKPPVKIIVNVSN